MHVLTEHLRKADVRIKTLIHQHALKVKSFFRLNVSTKALQSTCPQQVCACVCTDVCVLTPPRW